MRDLATARIVHLSVVRLTRATLDVFSDYLASGGKLYVLTNAITRFPGYVGEVVAAKNALVLAGADVRHYITPYLLHSKLLCITPDIVYIGSHNFSIQSLGRNIERSLRIVSQSLYDQVVRDIVTQGGGGKI